LLQHRLLVVAAFEHAHLQDKHGAHNSQLHVLHSLHATATVGGPVQQTDSSVSNSALDQFHYSWFTGHPIYSPRVLLYLGVLATQCILEVLCVGRAVKSIFPRSSTCLNVLGWCPYIPRLFWRAGAAPMYPRSSFCWTFWLMPQYFVWWVICFNVLGWCPNVSPKFYLLDVLADAPIFRLGFYMLQCSGLYMLTYMLTACIDVALLCPCRQHVLM
jgi:hypothetical protein